MANFESWQTEKEGGPEQRIIDASHSFIDALENGDTEQAKQAIETIESAMKLMTDEQKRTEALEQLEGFQLRYKAMQGQG